MVGCPLFDAGPLTKFFKRVDRAIRAVDTTHTVYIEPNVLFTQSDRTYIKPIGDPKAGFAFHDYCSTEEVTANNALCPPQDSVTVATANRYAQHRSIPPLLTEFGATNDLPNIAEMVGLADKYRLGWLEWAYTGNDKTSASPDGQALVLDPSQPPTGANVLTDKLKTLAEPYPQAVAGTPSSWSFTKGAFQLRYSTARADGAGRFATGSETDVAVPAIQFPNGYQVHVTGARVVSAPNATTLRLRSTARATRGDRDGDGGLVALVAVLPGADAHLVALGVGEDPERRRVGVADQRAARGERGLDPRLGLVVGDDDVEVDAVALRPRLVHLLEPESGALPGRVDEFVVPSGGRRVAEHGHPERPDLAMSRVSMAISSCCTGRAGPVTGASVSPSPPTASVMAAASSTSLAVGRPPRRLQDEFDPVGPDVGAQVIAVGAARLRGGDRDRQALAQRRHRY